MKRAAVLSTMLVIATLGFTQSNSQASGKPAQNPPAQGTTAPATPPGKRPPQTKTQAEYDAYQAAIAMKDPAQMEAATNDFATKFPDSEVRKLLFLANMRMYQASNNADKTVEVGRKVLASDPDDPEALITVANVLAERTRDTDLDKDQRLDEAMKMAQHATETVNTDSDVPAGTPQDKADAYKALMLSNAYSIIGTLEFNREKYADAENNLRKSIDAYPQQPDPVVVLRLALALDKQNKYPDALKEVNKAVELTQDGTPVGGLARRERDRLVQLTGGK